MSRTKDAPGMRGVRARTKHGPLRRKRGDTHAGTIENKYRIDLGVRTDKHLSSILRDNNVDSLRQLLDRRKWREHHKKTHQV
jgi:hypothetical protein